MNVNLLYKLLIQLLTLFYLHLISCPNITSLRHTSQLGVTFIVFHIKLYGLIIKMLTVQANCPTERQSTSGFCVFLKNNLVSSSSSMQKVVLHNPNIEEYLMS